MDKLLYVAMSGAKQIEHALAENSHNLANATTPGFKAQLLAFEAVPVKDSGNATRVYAGVGSIGLNYSAGPLVSTGRDLDIAIKSDGWIAVSDSAGEEAYTRRGDLRIDTNGILQNGAGHQILGNAGPVAIPPAEKLEIGGDGTISIRPVGQTANALAIVDRIRLVKLDPSLLQKGDDGLMRLQNGASASPDATVQLVNGSIEGSNVNAVEALVNMIALSRAFETQIRLIRDTSELDTASANIMRLA
jgi:flagellar basal-body rod protein FlgF